MRTVVVRVLLACVLTLLAAVAARADCRCVANGVRFDLGQVACIKLPVGARLARCEKVLNNSSWTILQTGCPQTALHDPGDAKASGVGLP